MIAVHGSAIGLALAMTLGGDLAGLASEWARIEKESGGTLGAAARIVETGETVAWNGDGHFPMQSVCKAPIAMAVLHNVDAGRHSLDAPVRVEAIDLVPAGMHSPLRDAHPQGGVSVPLRELLRLAVEESDGTASDVVLRVLGGKAKAQAYLSSLGVEGMRIETTEGEIGHDYAAQYRSWAAPLAAVAWLTALERGQGVSPAGRALLLGWMSTTKTFPTRLKGRLPAGTKVAHKTGSSGSRDGVSAATNDIGIVTLPDGRHLAIAVFLRDSKASAQTRDAAIAKVARAAWDRVTGKR